VSFEIISMYFFCIDIQFLIKIYSIDSEFMGDNDDVRFWKFVNEIDVVPKSIENSEEKTFEW
jgi:hypothetical protein